jgi:predicted dehydrogenase
VLLDLGVYPLAFASFAASGVPSSTVQATGVLASTGVDAQVSALVGYGPALQASVFTSLLAATPHTAEIAGSAARVEVGQNFYLPTTVTLVRDGERVTWDDNRIHGHDGLCFQAAALAGYVAEGRTESPWQPLAETVSILETADEIRRQLGVTYPGE